MYAASDFAPSAAKYTVASDGFNAIKDTATAAKAAIDDLNTAMKNGIDPTEQANQLNTAMMALSTDLEKRQQKALAAARKDANKKGTYLSTGDENNIKYHIIDIDSIKENNYNIITEPRQYFGPVDIQRLRIQIYDEYGRILNMNNSNYSFCLDFKLMYDL
jgi:hypothetical protein